MFSKLVFKNVTRSLRDYTIYFLTLMFGVCLFYMFNSIDAQTAMLKISDSQKEILQTLTQMIGFVSVAVSVILGFLVVYANGFLMKRRKKELGVYMTLGMPKSRISAIIILETFLIGLVSLAAGLTAGILLSQGMSVLTAKLFEANLSAFVFSFSLPAFWKTLVYFGVMFLVVMVFNTVSVSHLKLIDLLSAGHKNEKLRISRLWVSVVIFLVSVACLAVSYYLIEKNGMIQWNGLFLASLILGTVGTLLFFLSLSGFLLRVVQTNRKLYFKNLNMFILRQFNSKINTTFVSVSVICIMLLVTIGTLCTGFGMARALSGELKAGTPYDISLSSSDQNHTGKVSDISAGLKSRGIDLSRWAKQSVQVTAYNSGITYGSLLAKDDLPSEYAGSYERIASIQVSAVSLSDFNRLLEMQGRPAITLGADGYAINCDYAVIVPVYSRILASGKALVLDGKKLTAGVSNVQDVTFENMGGPDDFGTLILPDALLSGKKPEEIVLNVNYKPGISDTEFLNAVKAVKGQPEQPLYDRTTSREELRTAATGYTVMISYLALYIGVVFLIAAAAVLALQQLSEASDNAERYGLLQKLGAEERMVDRALFTQTGLYFLLPLSLAIVHSIVGIHVANRVIANLGHMDIVSSIVATAAVFLVAYGGYFLATYFGSRSMIRQRTESFRSE